MTYWVTILQTIAMELALERVGAPYCTRRPGGGVCSFVGTDGKWFSKPANWRYCVTTMLFVQTWPPHWYTRNDSAAGFTVLPDQVTPNTESWTISTMMFCWLVYPALNKLMK